MKKIAYILTLLLAVAVHGASAATPWYKVEVLVFSNTNPEVLDDEFWPAGLELTAKTREVQLTQAGSQFGAYQRLPSNRLLFNDEKARLSSYPGFNILFHAGWHQPVTSHKSAKAIRVQGGNMLDNGRYELDGYITIDKGRYLHFRPELLHSRQLTPQEMQVLQAVEHQGEASNVVAINTGAQDYLTPEHLTVKLEQQRRMRSKEVHYLDHPLMGVLVLITPL